MARYVSRRSPPLVVGILVLAVGACPRATVSPVARGIETDCSYYSFGVYVPVEPKSLYEVPVSIRANLISHLKARLGYDFYSRLRFTGGQIVDLKQLSRVDPEVKQYGRSIPSYTFHFSLSIPERGIADYCAQIEMDESGNILREIALPTIAEYPMKADIISKDAAMRAASSEGVPIERATVQFGYDRSLDAFVWLIGYTAESHDDTYRRRILRMNAEDGKTISWIEEEGRV